MESPTQTSEKNRFGEVGYSGWAAMIRESVDDDDDDDEDEDEDEDDHVLDKNLEDDHRNC